MTLVVKGGIGSFTVKKNCCVCILSFRYVKADRSPDYKGYSHSFYKGCKAFVFGVVFVVDP